jgi:hypothetical protein
MFFTQKHKDEIKFLFNEVERLERFNDRLMEVLEIQKIRIDALLKVYPNGINKDGSPRKKMGRKAKVQA